MSKEGDFDDIIDDLGGLGKYQKRLLYLLLGRYDCFFSCMSLDNSIGPLFFIMPFPLLHQVFVLHTPNFECVPPEHLNHDALGMNKSVWQVGQDSHAY